MDGGIAGAIRGWEWRTITRGYAASPASGCALVHAWPQPHPIQGVTAPDRSQSCSSARLVSYSAATKSVCVIMPTSLRWSLTTGT